MAREHSFLTMHLDIPPPLPDELIYSALARGRRRLGRSTTRLSQRLFSGRTIIVRPHLCGQLDLVAVATAMAAGWPFSASDLRDRHTLFPLASPLIDARQHPKCVAALHGDRVSRHHVGIVRHMLGITPFTELMSCPQCRRSDRSTYGEAYFHRIHQTGAMLCAEHCCVLQACGITAEPDFYAALDEVREFRTLRVRIQDRPLHLNIAMDLRALLESPAEAGSLAASLPQLLNLTHRLTGVGAPLMQLATLAASAGGPLSATQMRQAPVSEATTPMSHVVASTDARWLRRIRGFLSARVDELKLTYGRRIAALTLKREIESRLRARLPARAHIPRTAAYIASFVEDKSAARQRLVVQQPHDELRAA